MKKIINSLFFIFLLVFLSINLQTGFAQNKGKTAEKAGKKEAKKEVKPDKKDSSATKKEDSDSKIEGKSDTEDSAEGSEDKSSSDASIDMPDDDFGDKKEEGAVGTTSTDGGDSGGATGPKEERIEPKVWTNGRKAGLFVMIGGLLLGLLMGVIVQRSQFCMSNAFTFIKIMGTFLKFKSYMVALLVAIIGVQLLSYVFIRDDLPTSFPKDDFEIITSKLEEKDEKNMKFFEPLYSKEVKKVKIKVNYKIIDGKNEKIEERDEEKEVVTFVLNKGVSAKDKTKAYSLFNTVVENKLVQPTKASQPTFLPTAGGFNLFGFVIGGYVFGLGIVFAGGCASRILVRTGEGNLGSLVSVVAFGIAAGMALKGHIGKINELFFTVWSQKVVIPVGKALGVQVAFDPSQKDPQALTHFSIPELIADIFGANKPAEWVELITWIIIGVFALFLIVWFIRSKEKDDFWGAKWPLTGLGIGLLIVGGWAVTGYARYGFGADAIAGIPHNSLTFANPNYQFLNYLFNASAGFLPDHPLSEYTTFLPSLIVSFGVASVIGAVLGSFFAAKATKTFNWILPPDGRAFLIHILGGVLMGWGAVLSLGCNIGQGLSGFSVLGLGALITVIFIILGSWTTVWIREKFEI